jgi:hypothetical protein
MVKFNHEKAARAASGIKNNIVRIDPDRLDT